MTLTFENYLDSVKLNELAEYLDQGYLVLMLLSRTHTDA